MGRGGAEQRGGPAEDEARLGVNGVASLKRLEVGDGRDRRGRGGEERSGEARGDEGLADASVGAKNGEGWGGEGNGGVGARGLEAQAGVVEEEAAKHGCGGGGFLMGRRFGRGPLEEEQD